MIALYATLEVAAVSARREEIIGPPLLDLRLVWDRLRETEPALFDRAVRLLAEQHGYAFLATSAEDGSARLHPVAPIITATEIYLAVSVGSPTLRDLRTTDATVVRGVGARRSGRTRWQHDQRPWASRLNAAHVIAQAPEHLIQRAQPQLVAACIIATVQSVRARAPVMLDATMISAASGTLVATSSAVRRSSQQHQLDTSIDSSTIERPVPIRDDVQLKHRLYSSPTHLKA